LNQYNYEYIIDQNLEKNKKRRKRLKKEFNNPHCSPDRKLTIFNEITKLNKRIKGCITLARKNQIRTKLDGKNPKSFWNTISKLEGKSKQSDIQLEH